MNNGTRYRTSFSKTFPMATYLAAWAVVPDDFGSLQANSQRGKPIKVWARKDAVNIGLLDYALEIAKKAMDYFENEYFDPMLQAVPPKIGKYGISL